MSNFFYQTFKDSGMVSGGYASSIEQAEQAIADTVWSTNFYNFEKINFFMVINKVGTVRYYNSNGEYVTSNSVPEQVR
jgi:hypothetical protein